MSLDLTIVGKRANVILRWAYDSPASRVQEAIRRLDDLARMPGHSEQAQRELTDAGTQLSRLAGSVRTITPENISTQAGL